MKEKSFSPSTPIEMDKIHEFIFERFKEVQNMGEIVKFHTINKFMIMAHSPKHLNRLGNIVANHEDLELSKILQEYEKELRGAFQSTPTIKSHYNVLQHITGHFSADFTTSEKGYFLKMLQSFKQGMIELSEVLKILKDCTVRYDKTYLIKQTYFLFFTEIGDC